MFRTAPIDETATEYVVRNMRAKDWEEIAACRWGEDPEEIMVDLVADCCQTKFLNWNAFLNDEPVAALGLHPVRPGVWQCWMFATDKFEAIGISLTKFAKYTMIRAMVDLKAHRVFCHTMKGHDQAQRWLTHLGVLRESELKGHGRGGEDFYCHVWRPENVHA